MIGAVRDGSKLEHLATANPFSNGNRHRCFMDIQPHEDDIVHQARLPCLRLGASQPGATLDWDMPRDGPPAFSGDEHRVYATYDLALRIDKLRTLVDAFAHRFNRHGPYQALGDRPPAEYLRALSLEDPASHMKETRALYGKALTEQLLSRRRAAIDHQNRSLTIGQLIRREVEAAVRHLFGCAWTLHGA